MKSAQALPWHTHSPHLLFCRTVGALVNWSGPLRPVIGAAHSVASCAGIWVEAAQAGVEEKWGEVTVAAVSRKPKYTGVWPFRGCASPKVQSPAPVLPVTLENGCHISEPQCSSSEKWDSNSRLIELWESMIKNNAWSMPSALSGAENVLGIFSDHYY